MADLSGGDVFKSKKKSRIRSKKEKRKSKQKARIRSQRQKDENPDCEESVIRSDPYVVSEYDFYRMEDKNSNCKTNRHKHVSDVNESNHDFNNHIDENRFVNNASYLSLDEDHFLDKKYFVHNKSAMDLPSNFHHFEERKIEKPYEFDSYSFNNADQGNIRLKEAFQNFDRPWISYSDEDVEITFRRRDLQRKYQPVLQDIIRGLIAEQFSPEDLQKFLTSVENSHSQSLRKTPEGDQFFLDISSTPDLDANSPVPKYDSSFSKVLQPEDLDNKTSSSKRFNSRRNSCFNCSEDHRLQECPYKIDPQKVAFARSRFRPHLPLNVRYHVHNSKENDFKPGVISEDLRGALGLKDNQIPLYIYHMRLLGYPPGWLFEAAVESSGITVYGSDGNVDKEDGSEESRVPSNALKVQYDKDKLVNYAGFNAVLSTDFVDESDMLGLPPMQMENLRLFQEHFTTKLDVRPKRKKKFIENKPCKIQRCEEDMEIDDEDAVDNNSINGQTEFVPPLPAEYLPPPPSTPPPPLPFEDAPPLPIEDLPPLPIDDVSPLPIKDLPPLPIEELPPLPVEEFPLLPKEDVPPLPVENLQPLPLDVAPPLPSEEIPVEPDEHVLTSLKIKILNCLKNEESEPLPPGIESLPLSDDSSSLFSLGSNFNDKPLKERWKYKNFEENASGTSSPSLKELEEIKKRLVLELNATDESEVQTDSAEILSANYNETSPPNSISYSLTESFIELESSNSSISENNFVQKPIEQDSISDASTPIERSETRTSKSKLVSLGTPSLSRHSSYTKLPDYEQFSKNVTSHKNFENLPNSTGAYQKMKGVLKKVKEKLNSFVH